MNNYTVWAALLTTAKMPKFGADAEQTAALDRKLNDCFELLLYSIVF